MTFGEVVLADAEGAMLAHSLRLPDRMLPKGTRLTAGILDELSAAGVGRVFVARAAEGDVHEDEAATRIARRIAAENMTVGRPVHGRADIFADANGVVAIDREAIDRINLAQAEIQVATLPEHAVAEIGQIVATVKVIPFSVAAATVDAAEAAIAAPAVSLARFKAKRVGVVATEAPHLKPSVLDKTRRVLEGRLDMAGATIGTELRVAHDIAAVGEALQTLHRTGHQLLIVFGASATSDAADVVPAGIEAAGGKVLRIGMPVDPGNLLVLGDLDGVPVIGAPGCARSPAPSGFDWVLQRILAELPVAADDIARMGVGGVLAEKRSRRFFADQPNPLDPHVDAIILAAGQSTRMGGNHKLLATIGGRPLIRIAAEAALASVARSVTIVVGHEADRVRAALFGLDVAIVDNPDYRDGLSTSLRTGIAGLDEQSDGAIVLLGDMPDVGAGIIDTLIAQFDPASAKEIVVPTYRGKAGNPVLLGRRFYADLMAITGDRGARELIRANADAVSWIEVGREVTIDLDTPEAMASAGGSWA